MALVPFAFVLLAALCVATLHLLDAFADRPPPDAPSSAHGEAVGGPGVDHEPPRPHP